jgi:preprotein translocase subunit Sec63
MICEFLPLEYKKRLLQFATVDELVKAGYTLRSAYNAKRLEIISDERCDKLVKILGKKALPIIEEALNQFIKNVCEFREV